MADLKTIDELRKENELLKEQLAQMTEQVAVLKGMANIYYSSYLIDMKKDSFIELSTKRNIHDVIGESGSAREQILVMCDRLIMDGYKEAMREFVDFSTINERLRDRQVISIDFKGVTTGWSRAYFIAGDRDEEGNLLYVFWATRMIHEEKAKEEAARAEIEQRTHDMEEFLDIISKAELGIWFIFVNAGQAPRMRASDKMCELLGITGKDMSEEEIYSAWYDRITEGAVESVNKSVTEMIAGKFSENTYQWNHPDKGVIYVRCGGRAEKIEEDGYVLCGYHADVTDIVTAEKEHEIALSNALAEARRASNAKSIFLNNMSHDIRTPMNAIMGYTELLKKNGDKREMREHYMENIQESGEQLLSLFNNVLEMSHIESGKVTLNAEMTDIQALISEMSLIFEREYNDNKLTIERNININHQYALIDRPKCVRIFTNVVGNAVKYTPEGGQITISVDEVQDNNPNRADFRISVSDNGIGMSKEFIPHIFDSFTRERNTTESKILGTGLGMGIVKRLVELMGGSISVESELGKGTTISFNIPTEVSIPIKKEKTKSSITGTESFADKRILLAEDNDLNAEICIEILSEMGLDVERAEDGVICVEMLEAATDDYYNMILMDIQMPNLDGYDATRQIRKLDNLIKANIPIVAITANVLEEDRKRALASGMNGHLGKPIDVSAMIKEFNKYLL